jgi:hypothetical protein
VTTPDSTPETPKKTCTKCGIEFPATPDYFHRDKSKRDGLRGSCRTCATERAIQWQKDNKEQKREYNARRYASRKTQINQERRDKYHQDADYRQLALEKNKQWRKDNIDRARQQKREYRSAHIEEERERSLKWSREHTEYNRIRAREWRETHLERAKENGKRWKEAHPNYKPSPTIIHRRRARKQQLPDAFTPQDWNRAVDYFHGCCAVCGRQANDLFGTHTLALDHWIPLFDSCPDNPGTVPWNIVPLCHGENGCNNSKGRKKPQKWLIEKFGKHHAKQILERIEVYFEWVREQDSH